MFGLLKRPKINIHPNFIKYQRKKSQSLQSINVKLGRQQIGTTKMFKAANRLMGISGFCPTSEEKLN